MDQRLLDRQTFIVVNATRGKRFYIELPLQPLSTYRLQKAIDDVEHHPSFVNGKMHHDDIVNIFNMHKIVAKVRYDVRIRYMSPRVKAILQDSDVKEALDLLYKTIMEYYKIPEGEEKGSRNQNFITAKEMFCYIACTRFPEKTVSLKEIARKAGYKTHGNVIHHKRKVANWIENNDIYATEDARQIDRLIGLKLLDSNPNLKDKFNIH